MPMSLVPLSTVGSVEIQCSEMGVLEKKVDGHYLGQDMPWMKHAEAGLDFITYHSLRCDRSAIQFVRMKDARA